MARRNLNDLVAFVSVAREGSFTRAGAVLAGDLYRHLHEDPGGFPGQPDGVGIPCLPDAISLLDCAPGLAGQFTVATIASKKAIGSITSLPVGLGSAAVCAITMFLAGLM